MTRKIISIFTLWTFHLCSNISPVYGVYISQLIISPVYGVYLSQLVRYFSVRGSYHDVLDRELLLTETLLSQMWLVVKLKSSLGKFTIATRSWLTVLEYLCHKWPRICPVCCNYNTVLSSFVTCHQVCSMLSHVEQTLLTRLEHMSSSPIFNVVPVVQSMGFCVLFCRTVWYVVGIYFWHCIVYS